MTTKDDGGQAFPISTPQGALLVGGMSLRDWFAGQCLAGEMADHGNLSGWVNGDEAKAAAWCYKLADALLEARKQ